jgi:hypothetical protein
MEWNSLIHLEKKFFGEKEKTLVTNGDVYASTFVFESGVHGLRIGNKCGYIIALPFQGQQVWRFNFLGRERVMKSIFEQPVATRVYQETYGGFLLHCGATAMGVPSEEDNHPLHGELPNAPYEKAYLSVGVDENGRYIGLGGEYHHRVAFNHNYLAEPFIKLYENSAILHASMTITNLKNTDMELMYLMHINFRPVDYGRLVYSARCNPDDVKVHISIPKHVKTNNKTGALEKYLRLLEENPALHNILKPELVYDPEIVFTVNYLADENGNAHSMQIHPDGYADYVSHKPSQLQYGIRWIARTKYEDAMGLVLPATAEHNGYTAEKRKGNIRLIQGGQKVEFNVQAGLLEPSEVVEKERIIERIIKGI